MPCDVDRQQQIAVRRFRPLHAARAQSDTVGGVVALSNVNVEVDGNAAEGALTLSTDGHRLVQGTLEADALDPDALLIRRPAVGAERDAIGTRCRSRSAWFQRPQSRPAALPRPASSSRPRSSDAPRSPPICATASSISTIGEAEAFGGTAKGGLGFAVANNGIGVSSHMQFVDVDLNDCLGQIFGVHKIEGRGNLAINIDGTGASVMAVTRALNGTASLTAHAGALDGINVEQLLRRLQRRPLSGGGDFRSGSTPFDELVINLKIDQGTVSVGDPCISADRR